MNLFKTLSSTHCTTGIICFNVFSTTTLHTVYTVIFEELRCIHGFNSYVNDLKYTNFLYIINGKVVEFVIEKPVSGQLSILIISTVIHTVVTHGCK